MFNPNTQEIIIFIIICTFVLLVLIAFITVIIYKYQQRQHAYHKEIATLKAVHKNDLLQTQIEMQEQTFQNISREIHDNIGQKLTLAKLHLNTLKSPHALDDGDKVQNAILLIGEAINDLSDISRSMSSDLVLQNGLLKALDFEVNQVSKLGLFKIRLSVSEKTTFLDPQLELVIFRIVQEAINNILKHSQATNVVITLNYLGPMLILEIKDDGVGFNGSNNVNGTGLINMNKRASLLGGNCEYCASDSSGACIIIKVPIDGYKEAV